MRCFYHTDREAVGICKSCNRGLCEECGTEVRPGLACRGKCEADVAALNLMIRRSTTAYEKTGVAYRRNALVLLIAGLIFLVFGFLPVVVSQSYKAIFLAPLGCLFLLWSLFSYRSGKQISEVDCMSEADGPANGGQPTR
jgi:hypothetical protein